MAQKFGIRLQARASCRDYQRKAATVHSEPVLLLGDPWPRLRCGAFLFAAVVCVASIVSQPAFAELSEESLIGPGLRSRPAYDGSASRELELVPVIRHYGERWFARSTQGVLEGGARFELAPGLHLGAQLAYEAGRKTSESDFLKARAFPDIDAGASIGAHLEWDHKFGPM